MANLLSPLGKVAHRVSTTSTRRTRPLTVVASGGALAVALAALAPLSANATQYVNCADKINQYSGDGFQYGEIQSCARTQMRAGGGSVITVTVSIRELQYKTRTGWWKYNYYPSNGRVNIVLQRKPAKAGNNPRTVDSHILPVTTTNTGQDIVAEFPEVYEGEYTINVGVDVKDMRWSGYVSSYLLPDTMTFDIKVGPAPPPPM